LLVKYPGLGLHLEMSAPGTLRRVGEPPTPC